MFYAIALKNINLSVKTQGNEKRDISEHKTIPVILIIHLMQINKYTTQIRNF